MTMLPAFCREPCGLALKLKQAHTMLERVFRHRVGSRVRAPSPAAPSIERPRHAHETVINHRFGVPAPNVSDTAWSMRTVCAATRFLTRKRTGATGVRGCAHR
jgi:hypothetical protein